MAWPIDTVIRVYGALQQLLSADLNEIQERIVDLHRVRTKVFLRGHPSAAGTGVLDWHMWKTSGYHESLGNSGTEILMIPIEGIDGYKITDVEVKVYGNGAAVIAIDLRTVDVNFDTPAAAPANSASLAALHSAAHNGVWANVSMTPTVPPITLGADEAAWVSVTSIQGGDKVGGVRVTFEPITPTP